MNTLGAYQQYLLTDYLIQAREATSQCLGGDGGGGCSNCIEYQGSALGTELGAANVDREFCRRKTKRLPLHVAETINRALDDELLLRQVMSLQGPQGIVLPKDAPSDRYSKPDRWCLANYPLIRLNREG
jgi:hypothetical protein